MTMKKLLGISLALVMLVGSVPLGFSEPLRVQLEQGIETNQIQCDNDSHVLVERDNGQLACITEKSAKKLNWKITPISNVMPIGFCGTESFCDETLDDIEPLIVEQSNSSPKLNNNLILSSSFSSSKLSYFDAIITIDKAPLLDETVNFSATFTPTKYVIDNVDDMLQYLENYDALPENVYSTLKFSNNLVVEINDIDKLNIIVEKNEHKSHLTTFEIPRNIELTNEFILSPFTFTGTLTPISEGDSKIIANQGGDYTNFIYFHVDETESFLTDIDPARILLPDPLTSLTKLDESKEIEYQNILMSAHSVSNDLSLTLDDEKLLHEFETIENTIDQFYELNQVDMEFSDRPNSPEMIVKMPKTADFDAKLEFPDVVNVGEFFTITMTIQSNSPNDYEQIIYDIYVGNGLQVTSEKDIQLFDDLVQDYTHLQRVIEQGDFTPNVSLKQLFSLEPQEQEIIHTHLVKSLESGDWMIKAIINDEVIKKTISVN